MRIETPSVVIALQMASGGVATLAFVTYGRSPTLPSGAIWIAGGGGGNGLWYREDTDENIQAEIDKTFFGLDEQGRPTHIDRPLGWQRILREEIPVDRSFREGWRLINGQFEHDMPICRAIHLDRLRAKRGKKLDELDRDWMRATGQNKKNVADDIEAKRQALRDAPTTLQSILDQAQTIDELKLIDLPE